MSKDHDPDAQTESSHITDCTLLRLGVGIASDDDSGEHSRVVTLTMFSDGNTRSVTKIMSVNEALEIAAGIVSCVADIDKTLEGEPLMSPEEAVKRMTTVTGGES